ncbi:MAG: sigma-54-dependent Fis family transcriptional regulator [Nitrospirae bacterium]|nr:sigma-54-dependent Fis family transcriptional regulator [Nitrospirota bacterium]
MTDTILIVDDDKSLRYSLERMFEERDMTVITARNGEEALERLGETLPDLVVMDVKMPGMGGLEVLREMRKIYPKLLVIIITAYGTTETAIEAMKLGAYDYILKPFDIPHMWQLVDKALEVNRMMKTVVAYEQTEEGGETAECIVGKSPQMQEIYKMIGQVAESNVTVLLRGESGTGKELVARAVYHHSLRANRPFLPVNCAAIPDTLLESELFGHEKGAFTGAHTRRIGKFEQGNGGTIFLDEIGDMSLPTQAKILRVLQEGEVQRLGGTENIKVDIRLIVATNKDLEKAISEDLFREDLYYRLNVLSLGLPPLRERRGDIPELVNYFLKRFNKDLKKNIVDLSPEAMERLVSYPWPGNVRELENVIKRAYVLCKGSRILPDELLLDLGTAKKISMEEEKGVKKGLEDLLNEVYREIKKVSQGHNIMSFIEKALIARALRETKGNQIQAAKILGINRNTLRKRMEKFGLKKEVNIIRNS